MAKGIDLSIAADTRAAMSAINRGIIDPLEDVSELLEKVGTDSEQAGNDLERSMRDAQRRTDDAKDEIRQLRDELNKAGRQGKNTGDDIRDGFQRAEDGAEDFKQEASQTARETAASFDGSAESIIDMFQEVAANAFGGFGIAGEAAGLAAALGIGLAVAGFQKVEEAERESREAAAEWADAYVEAGNRILSTTQIVEAARAIITDPDAYQKAKDAAKDWGVSESVALLAMAGDTNALAEARASLAAKESEVSAALENAGGNVRGLTAAQRAMREETSAGRESLDQLTGTMSAGWQQASVLSEALKLLADNTEGATRTVDEFGDTIVTLPDGKTIYIDAETGQATDDANALEQKIYGIKDKDVTVNVRTNTDQAQRDINRFITNNNGRSFEIKGRLVTSGSGWD